MQRSQTPPPARPVLCLMGPTASGKSGIALDIAGRLPIEIISVDSALVYRGMDIGTAKPSRAEQAAVAHHLIDILDPAQSYSAAQFCQDATPLIEATFARGRVPLLVGGTMLYFKALREGLDALPIADPRLRLRLLDEARQVGWPALHRRLGEIDPVSAARLAPNDSQRIQRALEVYEITGTALSVLHKRDRQAAPGTAPHFINIALEASERAVLHERIATRLSHMFERGFIDEVHGLRARGDLNPGLPSMRAVGYRQVWGHLDGEYGVTQMHEKALAATRQLAKRQITWLRALPDRHQVDCLSKSAANSVYEIIARALAP